MKRFSKTAIVILTTLFVIALSSIAHAGVYNAAAITSIGVGSSGEVYIRWEGLPDPAPPESGCSGENNHWVVIPSDASDALKSLALSLYFSGKPARIDTSGCRGAYETVITLYSPGG
jgi:hypothetical protein